MSTQAIRNFIDEVGDRYPELRDMALAELEAIERAAKVFAGYAQNRFPTMDALNAATRTMERIAKDAK